MIQTALNWLYDNLYNYMIPVCGLCVLRVVVSLLELGHMKRLRDKKFVFRKVGVQYRDIGAFTGLFIGSVLICLLPKLGLLFAVVAAGLTVLYCIGEKSEEQADWENVLGAQLDIGLDGVDKSSVVIAYEPIWSIGPGKTPADKPYITKIARFVKQRTGGLDVVYGGGLKQDNAAMLASIDEIDGGLIALTRFSGEIGFYPDEYLDIIRRYLGK